MPGLMSVRRKHAAAKPLSGARIMGSLHMTVQTAVLIETLADLGADVRWVSCNIFSTQDHAASAVVVGRPETGGTAANAPVASPFSPGRERPLEEYWWCTSEALAWPDGSGPTLLVDDGGDATLLVHKGAEFEAKGTVPAFDATVDSEEWGVILELIRAEMKKSPNRWRNVAKDLAGSARKRPPASTAVPDDGSEDAALPAINVNDSVTKSKFDNIYGCRHSLPTASPRHRRHARRQGRGRARLRRGRQGLRAGAEGPGLPRRRHRDRSHLRAAGGDGGLRGRTLEDVVATADIFITATGNKSIITAHDMSG
jgi:adenosylhomocysteinase